MSYKTVYEYYRDQEILPTCGSFKTLEELARHGRSRERLFVEKLQLPPRLFRGADLIEFGPDSGENALIFAQWGAHCTLVEPNGQALPFIRNYFDGYGLAQGLVGLEQSSIEEYAHSDKPKRQYDFVIAEGFLYTIKPASLWMDLASRLLKQDGFFVFYFLGVSGCFFDLFLKAVYSRVKKLTGLSPIETSRFIFQAKWDSITHVRTLESWTMDMMENPFIRLPNFYDTRDLCQGLRACGLAPYSSWPPFKDGLDAYWHKNQLPTDEMARRQETFLDHSRLSFFFGRTLFGHEPVPRSLIEDILATTDRLVDKFSPEDSHALQEQLRDLSRFIGDRDTYGDPLDREAAVNSLEATIRLLQLLWEGEPDRIAAFCGVDKSFINMWGMPTHYMVFTKQPAIPLQVPL